MLQKGCLASCPFMSLKNASIYHNGWNNCQRAEPVKARIMLNEAFEH